MMEFKTGSEMGGLTVSPCEKPFRGFHIKLSLANSRTAIGASLPMSEVARLHAYLGEVLAQQGAKP